MLPFYSVNVFIRQKRKAATEIKHIKQQNGTDVKHLWKQPAERNLKSSHTGHESKQQDERT